MAKRCLGLGVCVALLALAAWAWASSRLGPARRWSDAAVWGGHVPRSGEDVTIPWGRTVLLDTSPPPLGRLQIDGTLIFQDRRDLALTAREVQVRGRLEVGRAGRPFRHRALLTLTGKGAATSAKVLSVRGGTLDLHGLCDAPAWTHLAETARAGAQELTLEGPTGWRPGDRVVIASTDFDPAQCEVRFVRQARGAQFTLDKPLRFTHWGRFADGVDERAEVARLSRNVVVQGDAASDAEGYGGHVMIMDGGSAHLEGVEFVRLGQRGRKGCYPVHFHRLGDARGSYVRNCSIHHCYNRCLTIHGTQNVQVTDNVGFDTVGHCFFLEDGTETGNVFVRNLGLLTRAPRLGEAVLASDFQPATFWISNPDNVFRGNVAAGSAQYGFWFDLPERPTGGAPEAAGGRAILPRRACLGVFDGNVAHSNGHTGLFVDNGPNPPGVYAAPNFLPPRPALFRRFTAYKNRRRGLWLRGHDLWVREAALADNAIGATLAASESGIRHSRFVGETANTGTPAPGEPQGQGGRSLPKPDDPHFPIRGFEFYDGLVSVRDVRFIHFRPNALRAASGLGVLRFTPFFLDPRNSVGGASFEDALPVFFDAPGGKVRPARGGDGYRSAVFVDQDGSVTGRPGAAVTPNDPFLRDEQSRVICPWNAAVSAACFGRLFVDNRDPDPQATGPVQITRLDGARPSLRLWGVPPDIGPPASFQTALLCRRAYAVHFHGSPPAHLRLTLRFRPSGDWVQITLPAAPAYVYADGKPDIPLALAQDRRTFDAATRSCCLQTLHALLIKLVVPPGRTPQSAVVDVCGRAGCR